MGADVTSFAAALPWGFSPSPSPLVPARSHLRGFRAVFFPAPPPPPTRESYVSPSDAQRVFQADPDDLLSQHPGRCRNWGPSSFQNLTAAGGGGVLLRDRVLAGLAGSSKDRRGQARNPGRPQEDLPWLGALGREAAGRA